MPETLAHSGTCMVTNVHSYEHEFRDRDIVHKIAEKACKFKFANGDTVDIAWRFKDKDVDEYTSENLPEPQIHEGIAGEPCVFH